MSRQMDGQHSRSLEITMEHELENLILMSPLRCIYRVPKRLRRIREEAYTPWVISIGPLHRGNVALIAMEEHKKRYLVYFLGRDNNLGLNHYIEKLKYQEERIRSCYSETIDLSSDEFVRIILLDAVFMVEFLFRYWRRYPDFVDPNDCIFGKPKMIEDIRRDLLMLENQIPFFILEDLFDPQMFPLPPSGWSNEFGFESLSIMFLSCWFLIKYASPIKELENSLALLDPNYQVEHLLGLLRTLCTIPMRNATHGYGIAVSPTLKELHRAGVKFKAGSTSNLFDIQFRDGILEIPQVIIHNSTELVLRNLVAFEQCLLYASLYICDYVTIMDQFVDSPKDVEFLVEYGIVKSWLGGGSTQLCGMINHLSAGVNFDDENFYYGNLCENLQKFCGSKWHKRMANLKQKYFNTPWAIISFVAAVILLLFTATQTICSIISLIIKK